jgi:hypothetical protein
MHLKTAAVAIARPDDVEEAIWKDFLSLRKAKRSPLTETALERIRAQAVEAKLTLSQALQICCSRGWQGFEAGWVKPDDRKMVQVEKPGFFMGRKLAGEKKRPQGVWISHRRSPDCMTLASGGDTLPFPEIEILPTENPEG